MNKTTTKTTIYNPHTGLFEIVETTRYQDHPVHSRDTSVFFIHETEDTIKRLLSKIDEEGNTYWHVETITKIPVNPSSATIQLNGLLADIIADIEESIELPKAYTSDVPAESETFVDIDETAISDDYDE